MNLIKEASYRQLALRTKDVIFGDWNPADDFSYVYKLVDDPKNKKIHSTYLNNLNFLTKAQIDEIESLKDVDENLWKVFGLGLRGTSTETIYTHWKEVDHFPQCDQVVYGLDFGFNHPNVLIKCGILDDVLYWEEMIYESKLTTDDLAYAIKALGLNNTCEIYADSARPDTIEELNRAGLWVQEANKSVWDGINFVKGKRLCITKNSINLLKEIKSYKWMVDKNGIVLEKPVKFKDDACFVGETKIITENGLKNIKDILPYTNVLTSIGFKKVLNVFNNGCKKILEYRIEFINFDIVLRCTPDHLIKVDNTWIQISQLQPGQKVNLHKSLITKDSLNTRVKRITQTAERFCTVMFGSFLMAQFQKLTTFITRMRTRIITIFQTSKSRLLNSILASIQKIELIKILKDLKSFILPVLRLLKNGTNHRLALNGTGNTQRTIISEHLIYPLNHVINAVQSSNQKRHSLNFAPTNASQNGEEIPGLMILKKSVKTVPLCLSGTNTTKESSVQLHAVLNIHTKEIEAENVYDLEVEDQHEYFANGVLVHNCDAGRYGSFTKFSQPLIQYAGGTY